jgi:hypothetical protein
MIAAAGPDMRTVSFALLLTILAANTLLPQKKPQQTDAQESSLSVAPDQQEDPKLPNGRSQHDEILKAEREQNIRDAAKLVEMAGSLKADLEKSDRFILSMDTLKKTDDIEKLVKKIRDRLHH